VSSAGTLLAGVDHEHQRAIVGVDHQWQDIPHAHFSVGAHVCVAPAPTSTPIRIQVPVRPASSTAIGRRAW